MKRLTDGVIYSIMIIEKGKTLNGQPIDLLLKVTAVHGRGAVTLRLQQMLSEL